MKTNGVVGVLPFSNRCLVGATPADKIPSHGTDIFGVKYAYDFMAVGENNKIAKKISWKTFLSTEEPTNFYSYGMDVLSPVSGKVIDIHDSEMDHEVRRSLVAGLPYILSQKERIANAPVGIAGNYIVLQDEKTQLFVAIVHLKYHSVKVQVGQVIKEGECLGKCGNSGNSTQPHVHIQAMDSANFLNAKGVPLYFKSYIEMETCNKRSEYKNHSFPEKNTLVKSIEQ